MQWLLDLIVIGLLVATLFHALRLERALGVLKRDRAVLEELIAGFNGATRQAEGGIERLRGAVDGAGRSIARQIEAAGSLKDDLVYLIDRGERLADRMDAGIRSGQSRDVYTGDGRGRDHSGRDGHARSAAPRPDDAGIGQSGFDPNGDGRGGAWPAAGTAAAAAAIGEPVVAGDAGPRARSRAEQDLLAALRTGR